MNVSEYLDGVRAALDDLPMRQRDELLEDLPEHLAEVAADGDGPLEIRLGPPGAYAAELRAAAGIEPRPRGPRLITAVSEVRGRLRVIDHRIGPLIGYATVSDLARQLRPAWWVLRGYFAAMLVTYAVNTVMFHGPSLGLLPRLGESFLAAALFLAVFVGGSVWWGRRAARLPMPMPARVAQAAAGVVLVLTGLTGVVTADQRYRSEGFLTESVSTPYSDVSDLFVYDKDGRLVEGASIYDQRGNPFLLYQQRYCGDIRLATYPRCPGSGLVHPGASASPRPSGDPVRSTAPTSSATPR